jgi:hypothetical protein
LTLLINEYTLIVSTGEKWEISECNTNHNTGITEIIEANRELFAKVPVIPESVLSDAKIGDDKRLLKLMMGDSIGGLARVQDAECGNKKVCLSYNKHCRIPKPVIKLPSLPECWEYTGDSPEASLMTEVVRHWKNGRRFIVVL